MKWNKANQDIREKVLADLRSAGQGLAMLVDATNEHIDAHSDEWLYEAVGGDYLEWQEHWLEAQKDLEAITDNIETIPYKLV